MSAYLSNILITDADFDNKVKELKLRLKSRMNGQTTEQMQNGQIDYALNYGVSLQHVQELAAELSYTPAECSMLWQLNIREAMLIAAIKMPSEYATPTEMMRWVSAIKTPDMVEQGSFFLFWRTLQINDFVLLLLQSQVAFAQSVAFFATGRALLKGRGVSDEVISALLATVDCNAQWTTLEARGASLLLRQIYQQKTSFADKVRSIVCSMQQSDDMLKKQIAFELTDVSV